jgi:hypothetical protein
MARYNSFAIYSAASEENLNIPQTPTPSVTSTLTSNTPAPNEYPSIRKRGIKAFEKTHERFTGWMDKQLNTDFRTPFNGHNSL